MSCITLHDKALSHLYKYRFTRSDMEYGAPFEISQDGVATALRISRSHVSIILKKMVENGEVEIGHSYVKNSHKAIKRMVYHVTEKGKSVYMERGRDLLEEGVDISKIVDESFDKDRLNDDDRDALGSLCVLQSEFFYSELEHRVPYVSCKPTGEGFIKECVRHRLLSNSSKSDRRRWHSKAADWCMDHDRGAKERLFHLIRAGRDREAICILKSDMAEISLMKTPEMASAVYDLARRNRDIGMMKTAARLALDSNSLDKAYSIATDISLLSPSEGRNLKAENLFLRGCFEDSLDLLEGSEGWEAMMIRGMCKYGLQRFEESKKDLESARKMMLENGSIHRMDVLLSYEALVESELDRDDDAANKMGIAISLTKDKARRADLVRMLDRIRMKTVSENRVLLQCVDV